MRVSNVHPWATFVPNFVSVAPSTAELARREKSRSQSLSHSATHSTSLFDMPGTEAFASEKVRQSEQVTAQPPTNHDSQ